jgi:hypothetical protein
VNESFAGEVTITARFRVTRFPRFQDAMQELSRGAVEVEIQETDEATIMPMDGYDS